MIKWVPSQHHWQDDQMSAKWTPLTRWSNECQVDTSYKMIKWVPSGHLWQDDQMSAKSTPLTRWPVEHQVFISTRWQSERQMVPLTRWPSELSSLTRWPSERHLFSSNWTRRKAELLHAKVGKVKQQQTKTKKTTGEINPSLALISRPRQSSAPEHNSWENSRLLVRPMRS